MAKGALDDFGTDYSSLGYLAQLPFHRLKIDRIFVSGAATSVRSKELLKGMVVLGRGLNMEVVGEGAENQAELCLLKEIGCNIVQGFVHSQAVRADEAIAFAHRHEGTLSTENCPFDPRPISATKRFAGQFFCGYHRI